MKKTELLALISALGLEPHPEGGYYKRTFESPEVITDQERFKGQRKLLQVFTSC